MQDAINITGLARVDKEKFMSEFSKLASSEMDGLIKNLKNDEDRDIVKEVSMKMMTLYQMMYMAENAKERESIQRQLNNYKSVVASISARHEKDIANTIIAICKKAAVLALSAAVSFVAL